MLNTRLPGTQELAQAWTASLPQACFEVNQRYLNYLKKALKRYLLNKEQNRMNGTKHH